MFPLHQGNELVFQTPSISYPQPRVHEHHIMATSGSPEDTSVTSKVPKKGHKQLPLPLQVGHDHHQKRVIHKEIERQRRQEMAKLHASLRSLLPLEHIKGKRAVSEHIDGAVNYIKQLEDNIKKLNIKRERLKALPNSAALASQSGSSSGCLVTEVTVRPCSGGFQILISCSLNLEEGIPISRVLKLLLEEGLEVVSFVSTKVNETTVLHCIQSEVNNVVCLDPSQLQHKLIDAMRMS